MLFTWNLLPVVEFVYFGVVFLCVEDIDVAEAAAIRVLVESVFVQVPFSCLGVFGDGNAILRNFKISNAFVTFDLTFLAFAMMFPLNFLF